MYEEDSIYKSSYKDDLLNQYSNANNSSDDFVNIEMNISKFKSSTLYDSNGLEYIDFESESLFEEENLLISQNETDKDLQNSIKNEYFSNINEKYNSNLNYIEINNDKFI